MPYIWGDMTRAYLLVSALLFGWAQQVQVPAQIGRPVRPIRLPGYLLSTPQGRIQSLPWLQPNQDYAIVPDPTNDPDYAGDTLISNGTGPNTRSNPPAACIGTFFDSLEAEAAYPAVGNFRDIAGSVSPPLIAFLDGAIAERYDITPDLGNVNRTVSIKGIALLLVNFSGTNGCIPQLQAPTPDSLNDGAYTLFYTLHPARTYSWGTPFYNPARPGTYPQAPVRTTTKPISDVRIGNLLLGESGTNCPLPQGTPPSITELFDFAYFSTPLDITDSASYYVSVGTERYNLKTYNLTDTLFFLMGPAYAGPMTNHPCFTGDTAIIGRSLVSWAIYDTSSGDFYAKPSGLSPTLPDWAPTHLFGPPINKGLNWVLFPIVYAQDITTGVWIRGDKLSIMSPYPNPATECFHLRVQAPTPTEVTLYLYTLDGRWVKTWGPRSLSAGESTLSLDTGDLPAGSYLLRVQSPLGAAAFHLTILR